MKDIKALIESTETAPEISSLLEAKMEEQDKNNFKIGYSNMGGGLTGFLSFDLWGGKGMTVDLGHYSGGRNNRIPLKGAAVDKIIAGDKRMNDLFKDVKIGERLPEKDMKEYTDLTNEFSIFFTQNMALDLKKVADDYENAIAKVLKKYGA